MKDITNKIDITISVVGDIYCGFSCPYLHTESTASDGGYECCAMCNLFVLRLKDSKSQHGDIIFKRCYPCIKSFI